MNKKKIRKALKRSRRVTEALEALLASAEKRQEAAPSECPTSTDVSDAYAVVWDYGKPGSKLQRAGLAERFGDPRPARSLAEKGSSPFDSIFPWAGMELVYVAGQYGKFDSMVHIPAFWYTAIKDEENRRWIWAVSPSEKEGYCRHPGSGCYVGRFHTSLVENVARSMPGEKPLVHTTQDAFRTLSAAKGEGWGMLDIATWAAIQLLYLVEFADFDSRGMLGEGYKSPAWKVGSAGGTAGASYHTLKVSGTSNSYRWIEDPFSNCFDWLDGFKGNEGKCTIEMGGTKRKLGFGLTSDGWISDFGYSQEAPWAFIPAESTEETESVPNYVWSRPENSSLCLAYVGGYYSGNAYFGFFYFNANNSTSYSSGYLGSRLRKTAQGDRGSIPPGVEPQTA